MGSRNSIKLGHCITTESANQTIRIHWLKWTPNGAAWDEHVAVRTPQSRLKIKEKLIWHKHVLIGWNYWKRQHGLASHCGCQSPLTSDLLPRNKPVMRRRGNYYNLSEDPIWGADMSRQHTSTAARTVGPDVPPSPLRWGWREKCAVRTGSLQPFAELLSTTVFDDCSFLSNSFLRLFKNGFCQLLLLWSRCFISSSVFRPICNK